MGAPKTTIPKPKWSAVDWELYTAKYPKAEVDAVAQKMNTAMWRTLRAMERGLLGLGPRFERADVAQVILGSCDANMEPVMFKNRRYGTLDTEPWNRAAKLMSDTAKGVMKDSARFHELWPL